MAGVLVGSMDGWMDGCMTRGKKSVLCNQDYKTVSCWGPFSAWATLAVVTPPPTQTHTHGGVSAVQSLTGKSGEQMGALMYELSARILPCAHESQGRGVLGGRWLHKCCPQWRKTVVKHLYSPSSTFTALSELDPPPFVADPIKSSHLCSASAR